MASSRFRSRLTLGQTVNRVDLRLRYLAANPSPKRLQAGVVTAPKISRDAVTGDNIVDGSVGGEKISDGSITGDKIQAGSITADQIQAGTITAEEIKANTITADQINARSIGSEELAIGAVHAENIKAGSITANELAANTITAQQMTSSIDLTTPIIHGGSGSFTGIVRATRLVTNDIIGVGPPDVELAGTDSEGNSLTEAHYVGIRPWAADPEAYGNSLLMLRDNGVIEFSAWSFEAVSINGIKIASRQHRHDNVHSHGEAHNQTQPSDIRLKKDVEPLAFGLDFITALQPVQFRMVNGDGAAALDEETLGPILDEDGHEVTKFRDGKRTHFGLIAQDVQALAERLGLDFSGHVIPDYEKDPTGLQQLDYSQLVAPLIKAVQELAARVAELEEKVQ